MNYDNISRFFYIVIFSNGIVPELREMRRKINMGFNSHLTDRKLSHRNESYRR